MKIYKKLKMATLVEDQRRCNNCGKQYTRGEWENINNIKSLDMSGIYPIEIHFGYESSRHDMEHWHFDLCEICLEKLVSSFLFPIQVNGEDSLGEIQTKMTNEELNKNLDS